MSDPFEIATGIQSMFLSNGLCEKNFAGSFRLRICEKESVLLISEVSVPAQECRDIVLGDSFKTLA